ncbi:MAG: DUF2905 family protein [candidate division Zixibacteria bacterium]|nr:DUF2905 family protein [candidate division Zixibacteria bacterium]
MAGIGKSLIVIGIIIALAGVVLTFFDKIPYLGKLPGDINVEKKNFKFYFPVSTSIIISVLATLILYIINRFFRG